MSMRKTPLIVVLLAAAARWPGACPVDPKRPVFDVPAGATVTTELLLKK